jgi:hypothetical protein
MVSRAPTLFEGGHFTLAVEAAGGERVTLPDGSPWWAATTDTTRACFADAVDEARRSDGDVGLLVGDLRVPSGRRPAGGDWAIPASYRRILKAAGLGLDRVRVWGEAYARNQGKRRLLDPALDRGVDPRETYAAHGWALMSHDDGGVRLVSDASLDWDGELRAAVLTRGVAPLCPLVFAGLRRAVRQAGYARHVAIYALADDAYIDVKLTAGVVAAAQLGGALPTQILRLDYAGTAIERGFEAAELVGPGALAWDRFLDEIRRVMPGLRPLDTEERAWRRLQKGPANASCTPTPDSRCSG